MSDLGLEPANLKALKPVLVNSNYVAKAQESEDPETPLGQASKSFAIKYLVVRDKAIGFSEATNSILSSISGEAEMAEALGVKDLLYSGGTFELATLSPLGDLGPNIPITIKLPEFAVGAMQNIVSSIAGALQSILGNL